MADITSLVLAIPPLLVEAIDAYSKLHSMVKSFREYEPTIRRLSKRLKSQRRLFLNECHLILRLVVHDDARVKEIIKDTQHREWSNGDMNVQLCNVLGSNYDACTAIIEDISESLREVDRGMESFIAAQDVKGKKATWTRVKNGTKLAFKESKYETAISNLRNSNNDLKNLREQLAEFKPQASPRKQFCIVRHRTIPSEFNEIRRASKALHQSLTEAWSCSNHMHANHVGNLFLNATVDRMASLEIMIISEWKALSVMESSSSQKSVNHLLIHSKHHKWMEPTVISRASPEHFASGDITTFFEENISFVDIEEVTNSSKSRKVRTPDDCTSMRKHSLMSQGSSCSTITEPRSNNLEFSVDMCFDLSQRIAGDTGHLRLGYLDSHKHDVRHSFFPGRKTLCKGLSDVFSLDQVIGQSFSSEQMPTVVDQLKVAKSLVSAVLQLHTTPWLNEFWGLKDFSSFGRDRPDCLSHCTLQVASTLDSPPKDEHIDMEMRNGANLLIENAQLQYGIRNLMLYSLGVALLQIGRWMTLDPNDVLHIRRISTQNTPLGPKYQEITQNCLNCDFGFGCNLTRPHLQDAVYDIVFRELSSMIESLDIS